LQAGKRHHSSLYKTDSRHLAALSFTYKLRLEVVKSIRDINSMELPSFSYRLLSLVSGQQSGSLTVNAALVEREKNAPKNKFTYIFFQFL
jgi:hypothetical protein